MKNTFAPADIVIYNLKTRTKVSEPSLIVYDTETLKVLAVGNEAVKMNCTANQTCMSPLHFGEIAETNEKLRDWGLSEMCLRES